MEMKDSIQEVLVEIGFKELCLTTKEVNIVQCLVECLDLVDLSTLAVGRRDCDLAKAENCNFFCVI
jgi:hypothetical protein